MNKTIIITILITITIFIGGVLLLSKEPKSEDILSSPNGYEYYWGDGCPHCTNVEDFFSSWDKKDQVKITKYEVWNNTNNAKRMEQRAITCGIKPQGMGVPLLFTPDGKCFDGDESIIGYFKSLSI